MKTPTDLDKILKSKDGRWLAETLHNACVSLSCNGEHVTFRYVGPDQASLYMADGSYIDLPSLAPGSIGMAGLGFTICDHVFLLDYFYDDDSVPVPFEALVRLAAAKYVASQNQMCYQ